MLAAVRCHAVFYVTFVTELRFLAGKSHEFRDWSPFSMGRVVDCFEGWMIRGAENGKVILDLLKSDLSPFARLAAEQPLFAEYLKREAATRQASPDGKTSFERGRMLRDALAAPANARPTSEMTPFGVQRFSDNIRSWAALETGPSFYISRNPERSVSN